MSYVAIQRPIPSSTGERRPHALNRSIASAALMSLAVALTGGLPGCSQGEREVPAAPGAPPPPAVLVIAAPKTWQEPAPAEAKPLLPKAEQVLVISVDGLAPNVLEELAALGSIPNLTALKEASAWTHLARSDPKLSDTLPNHTCMMTGRSVHKLEGPGGIEISGHGYTANVDPTPETTLHVSARYHGDYLPGMFDVAHDHGLRTALFASKPKFILYGQTWEGAGRADLVPPDDGTSKLDVVVVPETEDAPEADIEVLVSALLEELKGLPGLTLLHLRDPDFAGHEFAWESAAYRDAVVRVDGQLGRILDAVASNPQLQNMAIVLLADHGGQHKSHYVTTNPLHTTIPFYIRGPGIAPGSDLYELLARRVAPEVPNIQHDAPGQPVRTGDVANVALSLLGLPPLAGSLMWQHAYAVDQPSPVASAAPQASVGAPSASASAAPSALP